MTMGTSLTADQIDRAREMQQAGKSWKAIGRALGRAPDTARRALDPTYRKQRNHSSNVNQKRLMTKPVKIVLDPKCEVPADCWIDCDRRMNAPRTLTALLCGDPPPGYSALDRRAT
jgi:hypothetical protein